ncbi:MAG: hypothetical protein HFE91_01575 [Acutalibacter sp.]|jgi:hypothetical protein|uniref:hypothetical protein n=1 Tax=Acutalibacter sp. TaxID=1918636 RepID=UPI00216D491A|nr:hypothetical protein [Acutalibacter sp.]MCI9224140.1 hypothetical protein [Acutalibacter sp.]
MNLVWTKFKELPSPLQKQSLQRIGLGVAMLALFGVIWAATGTLGLAIPGLALTGYLLGSGGLLIHRCVRGEYLCMTGTVKEVSTSGLLKKPKYLLIDTEQGLIQVPVYRKPLPTGSTVALYLAASTPVYEEDGLFKIYSYLALALAAPPKKNIDETWKL